ncbi:hypothetical protein A0H76_1261 [Hepatospora eriocheir]|uniref:Uncharacterized protein n=1 Tax=Hepatospora eriocheir TaxID=1081669 RepID=A0A1X0QHP8_9MICR|nr:hypothetical protein A0H76_1261 [Hepatospora eriocheir]
MIWNLLFIKFNNSSDEVFFELFDKLNINSKQEESESSNQPFPEKRIQIAKSDSDEEPPVKRQKTEEISKMDEEIIPRELEETIELEDLEKLINLDEIEKIMVFKTIEEFVQTEKFEEIIEFDEQTQFKTLEKPRSTQNIIQYSHITEETFNFFVEFLKKFDDSFSSVNIVLNDIEEQYKEKICEVLQEAIFHFRYLCCIFMIF